MWVRLHVFMLCMSVQVRTHVHIQVRVHTRVCRARPHTKPSPRPLTAEPLWVVFLKQVFIDFWREEGRVAERALHESILGRRPPARTGRDGAATRARAWSGTERDLWLLGRRLPLSHAVRPCSSGLRRRLAGRSEGIGPQRFCSAPGRGEARPPRVGQSPRPRFLSRK